MTHLSILSEVCFAGHCTTGASNKVWVACLAVEQQEETREVHLSTLSPTAEVVVLCGHGPYGAALRLEPPQRLSLQTARKLLHKKWQEKAGKGYGATAFEPFVPSFGRPFGFPLCFPQAATTVAGTPSPLASPVGESRETPPLWRHTAALVKAVTSQEMMALLTQTHLGEPSSYAVSEKANGERCLVEFDGTTLRAYNRKGRLTSAPPEAASALCRLGHPFVIDGERLIREQAGHFVAFDVLEWDGESLLTLPYRTRLTRFVRAMQRVGLLTDNRLTPTLRQAQESGAVAGLSVLLAVQGKEQAQAVIEEVQVAGGEGVVIRDLGAHYHAGGFKYKFLEDIDAFVIGIEPGLSAGSLTLAMVRPTDGAIIEVGHVRSGLTDADVETVRDLLVQGQFPVFRISYLPASTIGISLVQPQTSLSLLRSDKDARDCTTHQFGPEKAALIAQARSVIGLAFRA